MYYNFSGTHKYNPFSIVSDIFQPEEYHKVQSVIFHSRVLEIVGTSTFYINCCNCIDILLYNNINKKKKTTSVVEFIPFK